MKKWLIWVVIVLVVIGVIFSFSENQENEEMHEKPKISSSLNYIKEQQDAIICAFELYNNAKQEGMDFVSQCLGTCGDYAVDIVHVPRNEIDNLVENQCADFREGKVNKFIELDQEGNIFRIV